MKAVGLRTNHIIVNTMDRLLIAKVKWHNHPVLHDLELDFCNSAGRNGRRASDVVWRYCSFCAVRN